MSPAEYRSEDLIELYTAFSLRKTNVDTKAALADEFSKLDFVDNLSDTNFQDQFYKALSILANIDAAVSNMEDENSIRFRKGRHLFDSQPARIGLIVAIALYVIGRPGMEKPSEARAARIQKIMDDAEKFTEKLNSFDAQQLCDFLSLNLLEEILDKRVGQVGRYERAIFYEAFSVLIQEDFQVPSMEACWRAG